MEQIQPLVSIGIPTYNRAELLKRSIESALSQNYTNVEVIVSDNASIDETETVCRSYGSQDGRLNYIRQSSNLGPAANFAEVLKYASGQFFMWLGDDDWIDAAYISSCVQHLRSDPTFTLVSGTAKYYRMGQKAYDGKIFNLSYDTWWLRVIAYYAKVSDNGMFYGVMNTEKIRKLEVSNTMGGDWLFLANIVSMGKVRIIPEISVHRELGGATATYRKIANSLGLPNIQAIFPKFSIAISAGMDIVLKGQAHKSRSVLARLVVGGVVFFMIMLKSIVGHLNLAARLYKSRFKRLVAGGL